MIDSGAKISDTEIHFLEIDKRNVSFSLSPVFHSKTGKHLRRGVSLEILTGPSGSHLLLKLETTENYRNKKPLIVFREGYLASGLHDFSELCMNQDARSLIISRLDTMPIGSPLLPETSR